MVKKQILVSIMVITLLFNSVAPSAFAMDSHNKEAFDLETNENIELSNEQLKTLPAQPTEEGKEQVADIANEVPVMEGENTVNAMADVSNLGTNLAAGKPITYDTGGSTANYPNKVGENLATDNDDTTYYSTGYSNGSFKTIQPGLDLGEKPPKYNVIRFKYKFNLFTPNSVPFGLSFLTASNDKVLKDIVPKEILNFRALSNFDGIIKFPVKQDRYITPQFNCGDKENWDKTKLDIYELGVYYDGSLLNSLEYPSEVAIDTNKNTVVNPKVLNADGQPITDFSNYFWSFKAVSGCANISGNTSTGEITILPNAGSGQYQATITNKENKALSFTKIININFNEEDLINHFVKILGLKNVIIPTTGTKSYTYSAHDENNELIPNLKDITWSLGDNYTGVTLNNSTLSVSSEALEGTVVLKANFLGKKEIKTDIKLSKDGGIVTNLVAGKPITYDTGGETANYPHIKGENLATDNDDTTYYSTGYSNASFKTIQPGLYLGENLPKYNVIKFKYKFNLFTPNSVPFGLSFLGGSNDKNLKDIVPRETLNFRALSNFNGTIKFPAKQDRYITTQFNCGSQANWDKTKLDIYELGVYYDGSLLESLEYPLEVVIDRSKDTVVKPKVLNADGQPMTDFSQYIWEYSPTSGCNNVSFNKDTGELNIPTNAQMGSCNIKLTTKDNSYLSFKCKVDIKYDSQELDSKFNKINGKDNIIIPLSSVEKGAGDFLYKVCDTDNKPMQYPELIEWRLAEKYSGVSISNFTLQVLQEAKPGTIRLIAKLSGKEIYKDIKLIAPSDKVKQNLGIIEGPMFIPSAYLGEKEFETAQFKAKKYNGEVITDGIKWRLKGQEIGVTIDENTGILSVPPKIPSGTFKVIVTKDGKSLERITYIAGRFEGAPNLLRSVPVTISGFLGSNIGMMNDGKLDTATIMNPNNAKSSCLLEFNRDIEVDEVHTFKDNGGFRYSSTEWLYIDRGINSFAIGRPWFDVSINFSSWKRLPPAKTNILNYMAIIPTKPLKFYEFEAFNSHDRFDRIGCGNDKISVPASGEVKMQLNALSEKGETLHTVTYLDGEVHPLKWEIVEPKAGVSIDQSGMISVASNTEATTVTVRAYYFGLTKEKAIRINKDDSPSTLVKMDYDWLTLDKLTNEPQNDIRYKVKLYNVGPNGSTISWESSVPDYITTDGDVNLPLTTGTKDVTLTATINNGTQILKKEFTVTVREPQNFSDETIFTDRELFGLWDEDNNNWAIAGKIDYSKNSKFKPIEDAVKLMDYETAKKLLYDITLERLGNPVYPALNQKGYDNKTYAAFMKDINTYGVTVLTTISIGNERKWYPIDVLIDAKSLMSKMYIFHSEQKEDVLVEIDSRESEFKPYVIVKYNNGKEIKLEASRDTTLRAGVYSKQNFGTNKVLSVMDSGAPIDSNTQRAYINFDFSKLEDEDNIESAQLYIHAQNKTQTGNKKVMVMNQGAADWKENDFCWQDTSMNMGFYSWNSIRGGVDFTFPPACEPETFYSSMSRLARIGNISSGYYLNKDENYAYHAMRIINNSYEHAGDNSGFPRIFDGCIRMRTSMEVYKNIYGSIYLTPEITTMIWKYLWFSQDTLERMYTAVANMVISITERQIESAGEFPEFYDLDKWLNNYSTRITPIIDNYLLSDGSYVEASDGYALGTIPTIINNMEKAKYAGIDLGDAAYEKARKSMYHYVAMHSPIHTISGFGDSNPDLGNGTSEIDYILKMAKFFKDDNLAYMGANGKKGGTKPDFTSQWFSEIERMYMRSSWTDDASYLVTSLEGGYSSHGHLDDFGLAGFAYGEYFLPDMGRCDRGFAAQLARDSDNHNTLGRVTNRKTGKVDKQVYAGEQRSNNVISTWASTDQYDFFNASLNDASYTTPLGYNRKIFFVKPNYWIISDFVEDHSQEGKTENKYDITWNLLPNSNYTIDTTNKIAKTNSNTRVNVQILSADKDVNINREDGYFCPQYGVVSVTDRMVFSKTKPVNEKATFDTVVYPTKKGELDSKISVDRLQTGVPTEIASAMHISRNDSNGKYNDYYYYSNEKNFKDFAKFQKRQFGEFAFDGESTFVSYNDRGSLDSFNIVNGKELSQNKKTILNADNNIADLSVKVNGNELVLNSDIKNINEFGKIQINVEKIIDNIIYNNSPVVFSQSKGIVTINSSATNMIIKSNPTKTTYKVGETLDVSGGIITVTYAQGNQEDIAMTKSMITGFDSSKAIAEQTLTITYGGKTATFKVVVVVNNNSNPTYVRPEPQPILPPIVTQTVDSNGNIMLDIAAPEITESLYDGNKTIVKSVIVIDTAITDKATKENPITINVKLSTEEIKRAIKNALSKDVEIKLVVPKALGANENVYISGLKVDKSVFEEAKISEKNISFIVETEDGKAVISWLFEAGKIIDLVDTDLAVKLSVCESNDVRVSLSHSGKLPAKAKITLDVGKYFANGNQLFLYYKNDATKKLEFVAKDINVANGKVTIEIDHCSDYVLTTKVIATTPTKGADTKKVPQTGDDSKISLVVALLAMAIIAIFIKRKIKE